MKLVVVLCALIALVFAQDAATISANDRKTLNYALFLERLESDFYNFYQTQVFNSVQVNAAGAGIYEHLEVIRAHENAHVDLLQNALGSNALGKCNYTFSNSINVTTYLATTALLEATGVSAYNGAVNTINDRQLAIIAATIDTVEARHAAYLNVITAQIPFPNVLDPATPPSDVAAAVVSLFNPTCPFDITQFQFPSVITIPSNNLQITFSNGTVVSPSASTSNFTAANDLKTLQFALVLEHLEATFYTIYQNQFNATNFTDAGYTALQYSYFNTIREHELGHVQFLQDAISGLGATPVPACPSYNFAALNGNQPINFVSQYLLVAQILENTGVSAYDGAIGGINSKTYQQIAATVATVEARHSSFINNMINSTAGAPFPQTTDTPLTTTEIFNAVSGIVGTCGGIDFSQAFPEFYNVAFVAAPATTTTNGATTTTGSTGATTAANGATTAANGATTAANGANGAAAGSATTTSAAGTIAISALFAVSAIAALL